MKRASKELDSVSYIAKPITIVYEDFKQNLADVINNSGLPPFIIESVLYSYLIETRNAAKQQYQFDKVKYAEVLSQENNEMQG